MAVIITNKKGGKVVLRGSANATITLDSLKKDAGETVGSATVTQIWCASEGATGGMVLWRANTTDSNNAIVRIASQDNAYFDFAGNGIKPDEDKKTTDIIIVVPGANTNYIVEFHKSSTFTSEY